jgi:hypothetical protein
VADIDESMDPTLPPEQEVARISREKALAVPRHPKDVVVAADTIVVCDGEILGKPRDEADAFRMLQLLSGRAHQVMTGLTVCRGDAVRTHTEITEVYFRPLSEAEIRAYIRTGLLYHAQAGETLPEGTPVYGVEVGQQTEGTFRRFGRFTAYGMTFYDENGEPAAQITQGQLKIPHAVVEQTFTEGGFTDEILPNGTIVTRWSGI